MLEYVAIGMVVLATASFAYLRASRAQLYRELGARQQALRQSLPNLAMPHRAARELPAFGERLVAIPDILPAATFARLAEEIEALGGTERSYLPSHKKGGTVAYETLCTEAPGVVALYLSPALHDIVSAIVGARVVPTPLHDQSSCSVLFYDRPGDHIGWHFDHNFYKGRHFTALIPIVNRGHEAGGLSAARLMAKIGSEERTVPTPPNTLVLFEGAKVVHKVTPIREGERRVILSMTFATDPRNSLLQGIARRIKDTAYYGIRALWT